MGKIWVQVSIDTRTVEEGQRQAVTAVKAGADWIEAGTPLITYAGITAIQSIKEVAEDRPVLADFKAQDGVAQYFIESGHLGAQIATVTALTNNTSIKEAVRGGREAGVQVMADLFSLPRQRIVSRARELEELGVDFLLIHLGIDELRADPCRNPLEGLPQVARSVSIPVGAVVFTMEQGLEAVKSGASYLVVGTPIIESRDALPLLGRFIQAVKDASGHGSG